MIKRIAYCDRCGDQIEGDVRRIDTCLVLMDESDERTDSYQPLVNGQEHDYCPRCIDAIRQFALTTPYVPAADTKQAEEDTPTPEPQAPTRTKLDTGKVSALYKAGWTVKSIAEEMSVSTVTIRNNLKKMGLWDKEEE